MPGSDLLAALRQAPAERIKRLAHLGGDELGGLAQLPLAGRLEALSVHLHGDEQSPLSAALLEHFEALARLFFQDMTGAQDEAYRGSSPVGRLLGSRVVRARPQLLGGLSPHWLPWVLRELADFVSLERANLEAFDIHRTRAGLALSLRTFYPGIEEHFARVPAGSFTRMVVPREVVDRRRTNRAAVTSLAGQLGSRLVIDRTLGVRALNAPWRWCWGQE